MKFVFLMDPLSSVVMEKDTSFIFMHGAYRQGHEIYYCAKDGITHLNGALSFSVTGVIPQQNENNPFIIQEKQTLSTDDVDAIFVRTDPPFDYDYLMKTWLLDLVKDKIFIMNDPNGIRTVNEKIWSLQFTDLIPPTAVTRNKKEFDSFLAKYKHIVGKPTDGFGGQSIFQITYSDVNRNTIFETLTLNGDRDAIFQEYVPEAKIGDKRILLLNGEPLGAVLRVHGGEDHRNNFFAGGSAVTTDITKRELYIIDVLAPHLRTLGLYFVGIDIMGDYLIEVNVTSPTCLQEMNRLSEAQLENQVISFVEKAVESKSNNRTIGS
ncbi:MAG: glutathione synthase [Lysobacterales bacterium]|jgi:glutathione synthase